MRSCKLLHLRTLRPAGLEPATYGSQVLRFNHCAKAADVSNTSLEVVPGWPHGPRERVAYVLPLKGLPQPSTSPQKLRRGVAKSPAFPSFVGWACSFHERVAHVLSSLVPSNLW